jgi:hypothetical protein
MKRMGKYLEALNIEVSKSLGNRDIERRVPICASCPRLHHDLIVDYVDMAGCMSTSKNFADRLTLVDGARAYADDTDHGSIVAEVVLHEAGLHEVRRGCHRSGVRLSSRLRQWREPHKSRSPREIATGRSRLKDGAEVRLVGGEFGHKKNGEGADLEELFRHLNDSRSIDLSQVVRKAIVDDCWRDFLTRSPPALLNRTFLLPHERILTGQTQMLRLSSPRRYVGYMRSHRPCTK